MDSKTHEAGAAAMSDDAINRAVAEARGWKPINLGAAGPAWELPNSAIRALPNMVSDPGAWGALLIESAAAGLCPALEYDGLGTWVAKVGSVELVDIVPGRALALAFLKATQQ